MEGLEKLIKEKVRLESAVPNKMVSGALYAPFPGIGQLSGGVGLTYKQLFHKEDETLNDDGFDSFEKWFECVHSGRSDSRLKTLEEGTGADGGYLVPEMFRAELWDMGLEDSIVRSRATTYPMKTNQLNVSAYDDSDHSAGLFGTVTEN